MTYTKQKLHALESSSVPGQQLRLEVARLQFGRSRALLGVYSSLICRFSDAEKAFEDSERLMEYETCMEIRLHRMLWYAEHKSRVQDWNSVDALIRRAHEVFMANDTTSEFIIDHFPRRFKSLCSAFLMWVPIDKITNDAADASPPEDFQTTSHDPLPSMPGTPVIDPYHHQQQRTQSCLHRDSSRSPRRALVRGSTSRFGASSCTLRRRNFEGTLEST